MAAAETRLGPQTFGAVEQPSLVKPGGIAVDPATGDVLVIDLTAKTVSRFNSVGEPAPFSALGTNTIDGVGPGPDETPQNKLFFGAAPEVQVAVAPPGSAGGTAGNIYVTYSQSTVHAIDVFASSGEYLGQLTEYEEGPGAGGALKAMGEPCGVAVDPSGAVYVGDYKEKQVHKFVPSANPPTNADNTANFAQATTGIERPCTLAAGAGASAGHLFVSAFLQKYSKIDSASGAFEYDIASTSGGAGANATVITADPGNGEVLIRKNTTVEQYDASGATAAALKLRWSSPAASGAVEGLGAGPEGPAYLARAGKTQLDEFGPMVLLAPDIEDEYASRVLLGEATLNARFGPEEEETSYAVEHMTEAAFAANGGSFEGPNEPSVSPGGEVGAQSVVSVAVGGLQAGTKYRFRFTATNPTGTTVGEGGSFTTYGPPGTDASCPNQAFRGGQSAFLPDCRAYEMVSPVDKNGGDIVSEPNSAGEHTAYIQSTPEGDKIAYSAAPAFAGQASALYSNQYVASREESGPHEGDWSNQGVNVPVGKQLPNATGWLPNEVGALSPDLCSMWIADHNAAPLNPDGQEGLINLYRRDNCGTGAGAYETLTTAEPPPGTSLFYANTGSIQGISDDLTRVFFAAAAKLTADAATGNSRQVYLHLGGEPVPRLVSILPDGEAAPSGTNSQKEVGGGEAGILSDAVSADGSRVYWTADSASGKTIYLRENPAAAETVEKEGGSCKPHPALACTVKVSSAPGATYWGASPDGSAALYSEGSLSGGAATLYRFDAAGQTRTPIAEGVYGLAGASEDLSRIYLASGIDHDGAGPATAGKPNLYLLEGGALTFIGTLLAEDALANKGPGGGETYSVVTSLSHYRSARVSPDGGRIAFQSRAELTGFDNADVETGEPSLEVFTYEAGGELRCASCNPAGARPQAKELARAFRYPASSAETGIQAAAWIPGWEHPLHASRLLSDDGSRLFFNSNDALVARDTNGAQDVYEWEEAGSGSCEVGGPGYFEQNGGCLYLISSGESPRESEFWEASASGEDVFFTTASSLVGRDNGYIDLYDARVGGGFAEAEAQAQCEGEACQSPPPAPPADTPASATYSGPGDLAAPDSCARAARKAAARSRRAKRLRRNSARVGSPRRARQMRGKATRLARNARKLSRKAKRCRRANRRAGR
ncbi:MAG TPA: hypothetical protein VFT19_13785 [Solirubrobacterales bacterium]|nr:hypothetical protein [Solirubrobacterales bacterium]